MRKKVGKGLVELEAAEKRAPIARFVISCRKFFNERGSLTDKQIECLKRAGTRKRSGLTHAEYQDTCDFDDSFEECIWFHNPEWYKD